MTDEEIKTFGVDIWRWGCFLFEFVTGRKLFVPGPPCPPEPDWDNDEHLLDLFELIGPLPDEIFKRWARSSFYFTSDRKLYNFHLGHKSPDEEPDLPELQTIEDYFDQTKVDVSEDEGKAIKSLLRRVLQYDPAKRPSAAEVLLDPWFAEDSSTQGPTL